MCRLPAPNLQIEVQDPRLSDDKFGFIINSLKASEAAKAMKILSAYAPLELINGNDQERPQQVIIPLEERGFEPNETDTDMLLKVGIMTTVLVVLAIIGVRSYFDNILADQLKEQGYNYKTKAVAPSYRNVK